MTLTPFPLPAAAEFSRQQFGGPTRLRFREVTVQTAVTELLTNNPDRLAWLVNNRSANDGAVWYDRSVTTATGILMQASRGALYSEVRVDGESVTYPLFGINATASGTWTVLEVIRVRPEKVEGS